MLTGAVPPAGFIIESPPHNTLVRACNVRPFLVHWGVRADVRPPVVHYLKFGAVSVTGSGSLPGVRSGVVCGLH